MKIEISFLAALLLLGTDLLARATVQGVERAFFSTAIDYGWSAIKTISRIFPEADRRDLSQPFNRHSNRGSVLEENWRGLAEPKSQKSAGREELLRIKPAKCF